MAKKTDKSADRWSLERSPSHLLHRALQAALDVYAEELGPDAPSQRQFAVLHAAAASEGLSQNDLVRATGIDRSTMADLVARMAGKGLILREASTSDRRAKSVRLSDTGRAALESMQSRVEAADDRILGLVAKKRRDVFLKVMTDMAERSDKQAKKAARKLKKAKEKGAKAPDSAEPLIPADAGTQD